MPMFRKRAAAVVMVGLALAAGDAAAQTRSSSKTLTVWDLKIGAHARELPKEAFMDYACGTKGGPPSLPINGWTDYAKCRAEAGSGLHEVYFRYDDEGEYITRARFAEANLTIIDRSTSAYDVPIIVSGLFDADGFLVGYRIVSDPRVDVTMRENGVNLAGPLMARFGEEKFACANLPPAEGETPFQGVFIKRECRQKGAAGGIDLVIEAHSFRKRGQVAVQAQEGPTQGQFESTTSFEAILASGVTDRAQRLATLPEARPTEKDLLVQRALSCPGCDLRGADLKRANLTNANLAGADLRDANLHGAILTGADLSGAQLDEANINRADLKRTKLAGAQLAGAMLYETRFDAADLTGANLNGALAGKVQLIGANLTNATIIQVDLRNGRLNDATFRGADLSGSALDDAQMGRSVFAGAKMIQASLWRAALIGADLREADVRGADFFGANLRDSDLSGADFSYTRLTNAILSAANTTGTKFAQAQLPAGFVPR